MKVEFVTWIDSFTDSGWKSSEKSDYQTCFSIGVVSFEDENCLTLGGSWDLDDEGNLQDTNNRITIPIRCITERKTLDVV